MADQPRNAGPDEPVPLTSEQRDELIEAFEAYGFMTFRMGVESAEYDAVLDYTRRNLIATFTEIDEKEGTVTIVRRPFGSLEGVGIL